MGSGNSRASTPSTTVSLGDIADVNPDSLSPSTPRDFRFRYIDLSSVFRGQIDWQSVHEIDMAHAPSRARRLVKPGDVLFGTVRPTLQSHGAVPADWDNGNIVASTGFSVIRARRADSDERFLLHFILSDGATGQARRAEVGSNYPAVNEMDVRRFEVPALPIGEQRRIGRIFDALDEAIHRTEQIIAKLMLTKQGLLLDLLTRGIGDDGELRDSDRPEQFRETALGKLPVSWEVMKLRDTAKAGKDGFDDGDWIETPFIATEGIRLIQTGNIGISRFLDKSDRRRFITPSNFRALGCKWVYPGDILICRLADPIGRACAVPDFLGPSVTAVDCTIYRPDAGVANDRYVLHWLNSERNLRAAADIAGGSTRQRISRRNLGTLPIPIPQLDEQKRIAECVDSVDASVEKELLVAAKLRSLKTSLDQDLLTGRVRVTDLLGEGVA